MNKTIITKVIYQTLFGVALSMIYMQYRPYESYTLAWPFAFLAAWFLLWGWIAYLRYDRLSVFDVADRYKKRIEQEEQDRFHTRPNSWLHHIHTPIQSDPTLTKPEQLKVRMASNFTCCVLFIILTIIF